eukprot:2001519-Rhodomonas_salina.1
MSAGCVDAGRQHMGQLQKRVGSREIGGVDGWLRSGFSREEEGGGVGGVCSEIGNFCPPDEFAKLKGEEEL